MNKIKELRSLKPVLQKSKVINFHHSQKCQFIQWGVTESVYLLSTPLGLMRPHSSPPPSLAKFRSEGQAVLCWWDSLCMIPRKLGRIVNPFSGKSSKCTIAHKTDIVWNMAWRNVISLDMSFLTNIFFKCDFFSL